MTEEQYCKVCAMFEKKLTETELLEMGFTAVDGQFDEDVDYDVGLYEFERYKEKCRKESIKVMQQKLLCSIGGLEAIHKDLTDILQHGLGGNELSEVVANLKSVIQRTKSIKID